MRSLWKVMLYLFLWSIFIPRSYAEADSSPEFNQYPGRVIPLMLPFTNEEGETVMLKQYFAGGDLPVILVPGYFRCTALCDSLSKGLIDALEEINKTVGKDYRVIYFSINPAESLAAAKSRKRSWLEEYGRARQRPGLTFLSGKESSVAALAKQIGFGYRFDKGSGEFIHPSGCLVLTPEGRISRYLLGVSFSSRELDRALVDAAAGATGAPSTGSYAICPHSYAVERRMVTVVIRIFGVGLLVGLIYSIAHGRKKLEGS